MSEPISWMSGVTVRIIAEFEDFRIAKFEHSKKPADNHFTIEIKRRDFGGGTSWSLINEDTSDMRAFISAVGRFLEEVM